MTFVSQVDAHFVLNLENSACTVASSSPAYKTAIIALSPLESSARTKYSGIRLSCELHQQRQPQGSSHTPSSCRCLGRKGPLVLHRCQRVCRWPHRTAALVCDLGCKVPGHVLPPLFLVPGFETHHSASCHPCSMQKRLEATPTAYTWYS